MVLFYIRQPYETHLSAFTMSEAAAAAPAKKAAKTKKPKKTADHPPVAKMVMDAIVALKDRKGSSLAAIKKYIAAHNKVDVAKLAPFIRRFLKKAVAEGKLTQPKGTGASGSFKVGQKAKEEKKPKKAKKAKKPAKKEKKAKKPKTPKKPKAKKATKSPKKATKAKKSPKKAAKKPAAKKPAAKKPAKKAAKKPAAKKASK